MKNKLLFFVFIVALFVISASSIQAATFDLVASKTAVKIGDTLSVDVKMDSEDVGVNAGQATIQFSKSILSVIDIDRSGSVFSSWLQEPSFSKDSGQITFIGGSTSGFIGKSLEIFKINFKVVGVGKADLVFIYGAITASDGSGTNVLSLMNGVSITSYVSSGSLTPSGIALPKPINRPAVQSSQLPLKPVISVPFYPTPNLFYNFVSNFIVQWQLPKDVTDVATVIDKNPSSTPSISEGLFDNKTFPALSDGIWYLHVRFKNNIGWGPTTDYRIGIDTVPPLPFDVTVEGGVDTSNPAPTIIFSANDPLGISVYHVSVDNTKVADTTSTSFILPAQVPGSYTLAVQAVDSAGNATETRIKIHIQERPFLVIGGISLSQLPFFVGLIIILLIGVCIGLYVEHLRKGQRQRRVIIAQRDIVTTFDSISKEVDVLLKKLEDNKISETEFGEIVFALKRMAENAEKMKRYLRENVEEIGK